MNKAQEKTGGDAVAMMGPEFAEMMGGQRAAFTWDGSAPCDMLDDTMNVVAFLREAVTTMHKGNYGIGSTLSEGGALGFAFILDEVNKNLELARRELAERAHEK